MEFTIIITNITSCRVVSACISHFNGAQKASYTCQNCQPSKRLYRLNPESSREDVLERNALEALENIPLDTMRCFANRSSRFMDAYSKGLNGRQAAWAARKYRGHRVLPATIMDELEKAHVT